MNHLTKKTLVALFSVVSTLTVATKVSAETPRIEKMVGGSYTNLRQTSTALVYSGSGFCSGVLVGPREILTAAHCIGGYSPEAYVYIGDNVYGWAESWRHSSYHKGNSVVVNAPYEIGMIMLKEDVYNVTPVPVLSGKPLSVGAQVTLQSYGSHENSSETRTIYDLVNSAKYGAYTVSSVFKGWFESDFNVGRTAICAGDSGGPAYQVVDGRTTVVGIAIYSNSTIDITGDCIAGYETRSGFVDLQAAAAQGFISNFNGVARYQYTAPAPTPVAPIVVPPSSSPKVSPYAEVSAKSKSFLKEAQKVQRLAKLSALQTRAKKLASTVALASRTTSGAPAKNLLQAAKLLGNAGKQRSLGHARLLVGQAATRIKKVALL